MAGSPFVEVVMASPTKFSSIAEMDDEDDNALVEGGGSKTDKYNEIWALLEDSGESPSVWSLRELALTKGGLVNPELRQRVWPVLAGLDEHNPSWLEDTARLFEPSTAICSEVEDRERDLIRRDVGRSVLFHHSCPSPNSVMGSFDEGSITSKAEMTTSTLAAVLTATISEPLTLNSNDKPHYYQGLHDLGGVLLENLDYNEVFTTAILRRLCMTHLRDNTKESFADLQWFLNASLMAVVSIVDPPVHQALELSCVPLISTVLPWLLTWFTHSVHGEEESSRLVDAFMASHPLLPFYVAIALLVHPRLRNDIVTAELDDPSSMHFAIQNLPSRIKSDYSSSSDDLMFVSAQELIETAISIMKRVPPKMLVQLVNNPQRADNMTLLKSLSLLDGTPTAARVACSRARMASGNFILMESEQQQAAGWLKPFGPPPALLRPQPRRGKQRKLKHRVRALSRTLSRKLPKSREGRMVVAYLAFVVLGTLYNLICHLLQSSSKLLTSEE